MAHFNLITWNIQWGRGCDGVVDLRRIVATARALADFDVLCLQEVASNYPELPGSQGENQPTLLSELLPQYTPIFGIATDALAQDGPSSTGDHASRSQEATVHEPGAARSDAAHCRQLFGNMIFSRLPVAQAFRHLLPWPIDSNKAGMQRGLVEAVIESPIGPLRVMTTHLEYYSAIQRAAQVERIRELHAEAALRARHERKEEDAKGPFRRMRRTASAILTGDFNFHPEDPLHDRISAQSEREVPTLLDAWQLRHHGAPHPKTLGLFDREQWPGGGYCSDFIYVSEDLSRRVAAVRVDQQSAASDHQPVVLTLT